MLDKYLEPFNSSGISDQVVKVEYPILSAANWSEIMLVGTKNGKLITFNIMKQAKVE